MHIIGSERLIDFSTLMKCENDFIDNIKSNGYIYTFSNGRSAIYNLMKKLKSIKTILFPDFYCPSMIIPIRMAKRHIITYKINSKFKAVKSDLLRNIRKCDAIFITDYFGQRDYNLYEIARKFKKIIIIDRTHSLLSDFNENGDYEILSLRKIFPVPDGGMIISKNKLAINPNRSIGKAYMEKSYSKLLRYIYEKVDNSSIIENYYVEFSQSSENKLLISNRDISPLSLHIVSHYNIDTAKKNRIINYKYLVKKFSGNKNIIIAIDKMPLIPQSMPIYIKNRNRIKSILHKHNIYIPILWRSKKIFSKKLLNIPIDDEYSIKDMNKTCKILKDTINANS